MDGQTATPGTGRYQWASAGDINAFFGLMLDNMVNLVTLAVVLTSIFGMPADLVFQRILPGTAFGILLGDLVFTGLAFRLSKRYSIPDVTAMPLGLDTVSLFAYTFGIVGPVYLRTADATLAWQTGMASMVLTGLLKTALAFGSDWIRRLFPPSALLGSIAGIALALIAFIPLQNIVALPFVGFFSTGCIFLALYGRRFPYRIPGALAAVLIGTLLHYLLPRLVDVAPPVFPKLSLGFHLPLPDVGFLKGMRQALGFLPLIIPFSIANVIGGIDVTASAEAAGDPYETRDIILTEGLTTLAAGLFGGIIQTTPYIGHPSYKKMGARALYTLLTALFIGLGGMVGYLAFLAQLIPQAALGAILIYVGLEITHQAFTASPSEHGPAVAFAFLPSIAYLLISILNQFGVRENLLAGDALLSFTVLRLLANGFILTALLWSATLSSLIDQKFRRASAFLGGAAALTLFGFMHSPLPQGNLFWPWAVTSRSPVYLAISYASLALLLFVIAQPRAQRKAAAVRK